MCDEMFEVVLLRVFFMLVKLNLFDYECFGVVFDVIGVLGDFFLFEFGLVVVVFLVFKLIVIYLFLECFFVSLLKRVDFFIFKFMFLVCLNYELDGVLDFGMVLWVVFNLYEVGVLRVLLLFVRRFCKVIKLVFKDDDCLMLVFVGGVISGFWKLVFLEEGFMGKVVFFLYVLILCVVCLKEREFWDRVLCVLFCLFFCDVRVLGIGIELVGWFEVYKVLSIKFRYWYINLMVIFI